MSKKYLLTPDEVSRAVALLALAQSKIGARRKLEDMAGYPKDYGGDAELLTGIEEFLARPNVKERLIRILKATT